MKNFPNFTSFVEIIDKWPSIADFAEDLDINSMHARALKYRNSLPPKYWLRVEEGARKRGIGGIDIKALAHIAQSELVSASP